MRKILEFQTDDIKPEFADGMAYCSCYTSTTGQGVGKCPHWVQHGSGFWCNIGAGVQNGGNGGKVCVPYCERLIAVVKALSELVKMAREK